MKKISRTAQLEKDLLQFKSMDIMTLAMAHGDALKLGKDKYMASGVIVSVRDLSGKTVLQPVMITDGFSQELIEALRRDIKRTYDGRLAHPTSQMSEK